MNEVKKLAHLLRDLDAYSYSTSFEEQAEFLIANGVVIPVRCKDCKHFNMQRMECENDYVSTDNEGGADYSINFGPDDFCSYGERKDK